MHKICKLGDETENSWAIFRDTDDIQFESTDWENDVEEISLRICFFLFSVSLALAWEKKRLMCICRTLILRGKVSANFNHARFDYDNEATARNRRNGIMASRLCCLTSQQISIWAFSFLSSENVRQMFIPKRNKNCSRKKRLKNGYFINGYY